jgi:ribosomal protein S18 acetylase RimI-like enzyme
MDLRPYDSSIDRDAFWELKRGFELGIGEGTGDDEKRSRYEEKLTDEYRDRYLAWVDRCVADDERCVTVADAGGDLAGYAFVLPERLSMIWDAAVLNEIYVRPEHRGTGVADDLMDAVLELARDQDLPLDRLVLDVDRENERAQAFYRRYDFEHWGEMVARSLED